VDVVRRQNAETGTRRVYRAVAENAKPARDFAATFAQSVGWEDDFSVSLIVGELANNTTRTAETFSITMYDPYEDSGYLYLEFEVFDDDDLSSVDPIHTMPVVGDVALLPEGGRGLPIAKALSEELRVEPRAGGKAICVKLKEELHAAARPAAPGDRLLSTA
jgi:hypothetical protein